ncbi:MAG TPA: choice-of-anchor J domain-containing protein [Candidatus Cloacimonas sp.]|nr:choice-of-anchor J domain-containing protein [Candidatus Cloacimonas sp.]
MGIKALSLCLGLLVCLALAFAEIVVIGSEQIVSQGLPFEPVARYSYSQQLFSPAEIGSAGQISTLGFQYTVGSSLFYNANKELKIWLGHSSLNSLSNWIPLDSLTLVYDNTLQLNDFTGGLPGNGWLLISLETPFPYNGIDKLVVAVDENSNDWAGTQDDFYCSFSGQAYAIQYQSASQNPDPLNPPLTGFNLKNHRSNIQLDIAAQHYTPVQPNPHNCASGVPIDGNLSWVSQCSSFDLKLGSDPDNLQSLASGITTNHWQFESPLSYNQQYFWQVIAHQDTQLYPSEIWTFTTAFEPCSPPQNLSGSSDGTAVNLQWQIPATGTASYYKIYRNSSFQANCLVTSFRDTEVQQGQTYFYYVTAVTASGSESNPSNLISVSVPYTGETPLLMQGFENCQAFTGVVPAWQNLDLDGSATWDWPQHSFPGESAAWGWFVFEPSLVSPPLTAQLAAYSGARMAISLSAVAPPNNDWLISPALHLGEKAMLKFWGRSVDPSFGLERLQVLISNTDGNWTSFKPLHSEAFLQVPGVWTEYSYDLSTWAGQRVLLAWRCVSVDALALCLDNLSVFSEGGWVSNQDSYLPIPEFVSYPNPAKDGFCVSHKNGKSFRLEIYNLKGQKLYQAEKLHSFNSQDLGLRLSSGIYFLRIVGDRQSKTLKQIILR